MKKNILDEECDSPIVISTQGNLVSNLDSTSTEKLEIGQGWKVIISGLEVGDIVDSFPLPPGKYDITSLRKACVFCLLDKIINCGIENTDDDSDEYIVYEIIADDSNKTFCFEVEVLDESNEIEFLPDTDNLKSLINYEQNRIKQAKK